MRHLGGWSTGLVLSCLLALGAGLLSIAQGLPQFSWVAWFSLLPLFLAIRVLPPFKAMAAGAFWGACVYFSSLWSGGSLSEPTLASLALLAAVPAAYALLGSLLTRRAGFQPLLLGLGWVGVEFALQPLALTNGLLAGTQGNGPLIQFVGSLLGYVFVAFLIALGNAALLSVLDEVSVPAGRPLFSEGPSRPEGCPVPALPTYRSFCFSRASRPRAPPLSPQSAARSAS